MDAEEEKNQVENVFNEEGNSISTELTEMSNVTGNLPQYPEVTPDRQRVSGEYLKYHSIQLSSAEMANLWTGYLFESLVHHVFQCFLKHIEDEELKTFIEDCRAISKGHVDGIRSILETENFPIPRGITSEDINPNAPRLFSDIFIFNYTKNMAKFAANIICLAYTEGSRDDVRQLLSKHLDDLKKVDEKATQLLVCKGLHPYPPYIPVPKAVDFVKKQNFLTGFFGNKRPLSVIEIKQLFYVAQQNALGKTLLIGFSQVAQSKDIQQIFIRGKDLSNKFFKQIADIFMNEDIPMPPTYDGEVSDSTQSPFSDRLMLFHMALLGSYGIGNYGLGLSSSQRRDLAALFARMLVESGAFSEDVANLMIDNGWLEQPPLATNRDALAKRNK
jgi:hypothetical protein